MWINFPRQFERERWQVEGEQWAAFQIKIKGSTAQWRHWETSKKNPPAKKSFELLHEEEEEVRCRGEVIGRVRLFPWM